MSAKTQKAIQKREDRKAKAQAPVERPEKAEKDKSGAAG